MTIALRVLAVDELLAGTGIPKTARAEELSITDFSALARSFTKLRRLLC